MCCLKWGWDKAKAWLLPGLGTHQVGRVGRTVLPMGLVFSNLPLRAGSCSANLPWPSCMKGMLSLSSQGNPDEWSWFGICSVGGGAQIKTACPGKMWAKSGKTPAVESRPNQPPHTVTSARKPWSAKGAGCSWGGACVPTLVALPVIKACCTGELI